MFGFTWPFGKDTTSETNNSVVPSATSASSPSSTPVQRGSLREARKQKADDEFAEFIRSLESNKEEGSLTVVPPSAAVGGIAPPVTKPEHTPYYEPRIYEDGTVDIRPEVMYPRSMSCRQAFDQAFYCQSLGGKFNDVYRYGAIKSCDEQWSAFWFCMRTRTLDTDEKGRQTMEHYKIRDEKRRKKCGSSEDVWDIRTRSVERAFWKDPDESGE